MRWRRPLLILNPRAGRSGVPQAAQQHAERFFAAHDTPCTVRTVEGSTDAHLWSSAAAQEGFDLLVVAGGDGTLRQVAAGVQESTPLPIALLPTGSANLLAQNLGIPIRTEAALETIAAGRTRQIDLGVVTSHGDALLTAVTVGYGSRIFEDARREFKHFLGFPAYVLAAMKNIIRVPTAHFTCVLDGTARAFDAQMVIVTNTSLNHFRPLHLSADIAVDDGLLDVFVFSHETFVATAELIIGMALKRTQPASRLAHFRVRSATIAAEPQLPVAIDGDVVHGGTVEVQVLPGALEIVRGE